MGNDEFTEIAELDLRGFQCPLPVLKTRNQLRKMQVGECIWVLTDDPLAGVDIPHFCSEFDQELLEQSTDESDGNRFLIRRNGEKL